MRVLVWIVEDTWRPTVAAAAAFLPADAEITLLHVTASEAVSVAHGARHGLLRRSHPPSAEPLHAISEQSARPHGSARVFAPSDSSSTGRS